MNTSERAPAGIDPKLLEILVCPLTKRTLEYDAEKQELISRAAKLALRTQQVIAHESGATDTVDPFAGSYYVEALTAEIERRARGLIDKVDEMGGSVEAIAFIKSEIEESAFGYHERYRTKQDIVVGVNKYEEDDVEVEDILRVDPESDLHVDPEQARGQPVPEPRHW